jgi:hypothetical protein
MEAAAKVLPEAAANILPLRPLDARVLVDGERLVVERLVIADPTLAAFVADRAAAERVALVERALRIGLLALQDAGVTVNVDVVRREFEAFLKQSETANERAAVALDQMLRQNFADGDGRLPRTLERFLGDRGSLRSFVNELFDESKRDSAIGRMKLLLGTYFDGDASRLAQLLDPTRLGSPLHQFRTEVAAGFEKLNSRLVALEAASAARNAERSRSAAKGGDFEDLLASMLATIARGSGDALERTSDEGGSVIRSKKGDFVLTVDPAVSRGAELRIVVEAKDRVLSARVIRDELREARENRGAAVALAVFTPRHAPAGVEPFAVLGGDVYCVVDPEAPEAAFLEAAVRLARILALATLRDASVEIDAQAVATALTGIREQLEAVRRMKTQLTSIGTVSRDVAGTLDRLRDGVLARVCEVEAEMRVVESAVRASDTAQAR